MKERTRALGWLLVFAYAAAANTGAVAAQSAEAVQLEIEDCAGAPASEVRRLVALEIAPRGRLASAERSPPSVRGGIRCQHDSARIWVEDTSRAAPLRLEITLRDLAPSARPRLLALALAELIATSRMRRAPPPSAAATAAPTDPGSPNMRAAHASGDPQRPHASDAPNPPSRGPHADSNPQRPQPSDTQNPPSRGPHADSDPQRPHTSDTQNPPSRGPHADSDPQRPHASDAPNPPSRGPRDDSDPQRQPPSGTQTPSAQAASALQRAAPAAEAQRSRAAQPHGDLQPEPPTTSPAAEPQPPSAAEAALSPNAAHTRAPSGEPTAPASSFQVWLGAGATRAADPGSWAAAVSAGAVQTWPLLAAFADVRVELARGAKRDLRLGFEALSLALGPAWCLRNQHYQWLLGPALRAGYARLHATSSDNRVLSRALPGFWFGPCVQTALHVALSERFALRVGVELGYVTQSIRGHDVSGAPLLALAGPWLSAHAAVSWGGSSTAP